MQANLLQFPLKSHRKTITVPRESYSLAELMGAIFGDGGINNDWQLVISLNSLKDYSYSKYLTNLLEKLFSINVVSRKRPRQNTLVLVCSSTSLVDFLISKGAIRGNKIIQDMDIPLWIKEEYEYKKAFVRGLMDTDGCLYIHKHFVSGKKYINLGLCFTSYSKKLLQSVAKIFQEMGIIPHVSSNSQRIYLYSQRDVIKYLNIFGSSNFRIIETAKKWWDVRAV